jgi:putative FmdB family regulatory protein
MPVYEYKCTECNKQFEIMQKITDDPLNKCGSCGGELKKLITNTSFVLKGSGWYVTDYPSDDRKKAKEKSKPAAEGKDKSKENKTETKKEPVKA